MTTFNYAVGRPWDITKPDGHIGFYSYGCTNQFGTLTDAKEFQQYCNDQIDKKDQGDVIRGKYKIYQLVELLE